MTIKERIMAVVEGRRPDKVPWFADLNHWYNINREHFTLPKKYEKLDILGLHKAVGAGIGYGAAFHRVETQEVVRVTGTEERGRAMMVTEIFRTPLGELRRVSRRTTMAESFAPVEYLIKGVEDFNIYEFILKDRKITPLYGPIAEAAEYIGDQGIVSIGTGYSPFQQLIIPLMGQVKGLLTLFDYPKETEAFLRILDEQDDEIYQLACESPAQFVWLGDNIDAMITSPKLFERYCLPYYQKRTEQLHRYGKICACHMDGRLKGLLPMLKDTGFDIIESVTPLPMGDVSMEEVAAHKDNLIMWGGMCASVFCEPYTYEDVKEHLIKWIDTIGEGVVVGIADQIPPDGDIEKVRLISEVVESG